MKLGKAVDVVASWGATVVRAKSYTPVALLSKARLSRSDSE